MSKKLFSTIFVLLLGVVIGLGAAPTATAYKGTITVAMTGEPDTLDPHLRTGFYNQIGWRHVYDTLVHRNPGESKFIPWLAEKYVVLTPRKVKYTLRNAKFTDGSRVTSEAVKYSVGRIFDPKNKSVIKHSFKTLDRIEVIDDRTFIWHLKSTDTGLFATSFYRPHIASLGTKNWDLKKFAKNAIGSGPYVLKSWAKGQKMVFEANPNWWGNSKYPNRPKTVVFRRIRESTTRVKALLAGEVDIIQGVKPQHIAQIQKAKGAEVSSSLSTRVMMLGFFNRFGGPFADLNVRKAVNYAIDVGAIRDSFLRGKAKNIGQMFHPWSYVGYNSNKKWYPYDLAKAKEHMKKSAHAKGFKAVLIAPSGRMPADKQTCEAVSTMLKPIGIDTSCRALRWPLYRKNFRAYRDGKKKSPPAMYYMGMGNAPGNPYGVGMAQTGCKGGWSGQCYKDLDKAFDAARAIPDHKKQQAAFEAVTDLMRDKATHKFFFNVNVDWGYRTKGIKFKVRNDEVFFGWEVAMQ